jgi:hypothetical protein
LVASAFNSVFGPVSPDTLARLRASWEALNNGWNQWVLDYSQSRQLNILKDIGFASPRWEDLVLVLAALLVVVSLLSAAWTLWERRQSDPWLRLLQRTRTRALRAGLALPASAAPRHIAAMLQQRFGAQATAALRAWLLQLEAQRYAQLDGAEARRTLAQLQREFRQLTWPTS